MQIVERFMCAYATNGAAFGCKIEKPLRLRGTQSEGP